MIKSNRDCLWKLTSMFFQPVPLNSEFYLFDENKPSFAPSEMFLCNLLHKIMKMI